MKYTRENLTEYINSEISKWLEKENFFRPNVDDKVTFSKIYHWGWDNCSLNRILFLDTHLEFGINVSRRYYFIENLWNEYRILLNSYASNESNVFLPSIIVNHGNASEKIKQKSYFDGSLRFEISEKGLAEIPQAIEFVMSKIFEKLNLFLDIQELDKYINTQFQQDEHLSSLIYWEGSMYKRIAFAKYANNPNYENLCDFMRTSFDWFIENGKVEGQEYFLNYPLVFEKVYERLKNIEPLSNTVLSDETI